MVQKYFFCCISVFAHAVFSIKTVINDLRKFNFSSIKADKTFFHINLKIFDHIYGKPFWTKVVEFYWQGLEFTRRVKILLAGSGIYSQGRDFIRIV